MLLLSGPSANEKPPRASAAGETQTWRFTATALIAVVLGLLVSQKYLALVPLSLALFGLLPRLRSAKKAWGCAALYYAAVTWTLLPGAAIFYGHTFHPLRMALLWIAVSSALGLPWAFLSAPRSYLWLTIPLCLTLETFPPLGLVSVGNPLTAAGLLFPHTAWFGLLLLAALAVVLGLHPRVGAIVLLSLLPLSQIPDAIPPSGWVAIDTTFGGQGFESASALNDYHTGLSIQQTIWSSQANVLLFSEGVLSNWTEATDLFWNQTITQLNRKHQIILIGTHLAEHPSGYSNVLLFRGDAQGLYRQRVPIPVAMWNPLRPSSVPLNLSGQSVIALQGQRPAFFLCYEELLPWLYLRSFGEHPTVLLGASNQYWAHSTVFPQVAATSMTAWAHLFYVPVLRASNR